MLSVPFIPMPTGVKIAAVVVLAASLFSAGWLANGWRLGAELATVRAEHAGQAAAQAATALSTMKADADAIHTAAQQLGTIETTLGPKIDALKKEIKNAKPLPAGCIPDAGRVRSLDAAIDAANSAAAARQ